MTEEEQIFALLQYGDSFFPSGAVSFSWGVEMLVNDSAITSINEINNFIENQIFEKWLPFDKIILAHSYNCAEDTKSVIEIDQLVECMILATELRCGSKRLGTALLSTFKKLNNKSAQHYLEIINDQKAFGHLPVMQGLIWKSIGLSQNFSLLLSAYTLCVSILSAALRLGIIGHLDCQNSLMKFRKMISELITLPIPEINEIYSFTPICDIASMRHEVTNTRLFSN